MAMRLTNAAASAAADSTGLRGYISTTPKLIIYTGNVNANNELAPAGTVLATITVGNFGVASNGVISSIGGSATAAASGKAACWALFQTNATTKVADGTVGQGSGDISFDEDDFLAGGTVAVATFTLTIPPA